MKKRVAPLLLFLLAAPALSGGEEFAATPSIPARVPKIKVGDWVEFIQDGVTFRHRAEWIERTDSETFVHFTIETLDGEGLVAKRETTAIAGTQELEVNRRYLEAFRERGAAGVAENVSVGGRPVPAVRFAVPESGAEFWFSDRIGILNLIRFEPGTTGEPGLDAVDFGNDDRRAWERN